jgi:hypothetical protein
VVTDGDDAAMGSITTFNTGDKAHRLLQIHKTMCPEGFNIHGVWKGSRGYVDDADSNQSYWLLNRETVNTRISELNRNGVMPPRPSNERAPAAVRCIFRVVSPPGSVPIARATAAVWQHERGVAITDAASDAHQSTVSEYRHLVDITATLLTQPIIAALTRDPSAPSHTLSITLSARATSAFIAERYKAAGAGVVSTHSIVTPINREFQVLGDEVVPLMVEMGRYAAALHAVETISNAPTVSPICLYESISDDQRVLRVDVVFRGTDASTTARQVVCTNIVTGLNRFMREEMTILVQKDEPVSVPPETVLRLDAGPKSNGVSLIWPVVVLSQQIIGNHLQKNVQFIVREQLGAHGGGDAIQASVNVGSRNPVYGSGNQDGSLPASLCTGVWLPFAQVWETDLTVALAGTAWPIPGLGLAHIPIRPDEQNALARDHARYTNGQKWPYPTTVHALLPWICSCNPFGRKLLDVSAARARVTVGIYSDLVSVNDQRLNMERDNYIVSPDNDASNCVDRVLDIMNGLNPYRARNWTSALDIGNLIHSVTYGTLEGMFAWAEWVMTHRMDTALFGYNDLAGHWRHFGTSACTGGQSSMKTRVFTVHATSGVASNAPGGGLVANSGAVNTHQQSINTLHGMLRNDNPIRMHQFLSRESRYHHRAEQDPVGAQCLGGERNLDRGPGAGPTDVFSQMVEQFGEDPTERTLAMWLLIRLRDSVVVCDKETYIFKGSGCHRWVLDRSQHELKRHALMLLSEFQRTAVASFTAEVDNLVTALPNPSVVLAAPQAPAAPAPAMGRGGGFMGDQTGLNNTHARGGPGRRRAGQTANLRAAAAIIDGALRRQQQQQQAAAPVLDAAVAPPPPPATAPLQGVQITHPNNPLLVAATAADTTSLRICQLIGNYRSLMGVVNMLMSDLTDPDFKKRLDTRNCIAFVNGVLCMKDRKLRPGRPSDGCLRGVWWSYSDLDAHDADVNTYETLFSRMLRFHDMLQQCADQISVFLNVGNAEKMWTFLHGQTNGGKSVFMRWSGNGFGNLQTTLPVAEFTDHREASASGHTAHLSAAQGSRVAVIYEPQFGQHTFSLHKIKCASSNDPQPIRDMYAEQRQEVYSWHPLSISNTVASIRGSIDDATAMRLFFLLFGSTFTCSVPDTVSQEEQFAKGTFPMCNFTSGDMHTMGKVLVSHSFTNYCRRNMDSPTFAPTRSRRSILESMGYMGEVTEFRNWMYCFVMPNSVIGMVSRLGDRILHELQTIALTMQARRTQPTDPASSDPPAGPSGDGIDTMHTGHGGKWWNMRMHVYTLFDTMYKHGHASKRQDWLNTLLPSQPHPWLPLCVNRMILHEMPNPHRPTDHPIGTLMTGLAPGDGTALDADHGFGAMQLDAMCQYFSLYKRSKGLTQPVGTYYANNNNGSSSSTGGGQGGEGGGDQQQHGGDGGGRGNQNFGSGGGGGDQQQQDGQKRSGGGGGSRTTLQGYPRNLRAPYHGMDPIMLKRIISENVSRQLLDESMPGCSVLPMYSPDGNFIPAHDGAPSSASPSSSSSSSSSHVPNPYVQHPGSHGAQDQCDAANGAILSKLHQAFGDHLASINTNKCPAKRTMDRLAMAYMTHNDVPPLHCHVLDHSTILGHMARKGEDGGAQTHPPVKRKRDTTTGDTTHARRRAKTGTGSILDVLHTTTANAATGPYARDTPLVQKLTALDLEFYGPLLPTSTTDQEVFEEAMERWEERNADLTTLITTTTRQIRIQLRLDEPEIDANARDPGAAFSSSSPLEFNENVASRNVMYTTTSGNWIEAQTQMSHIRLAYQMEAEDVDRRNTLTHVPHGFTHIGEVSATISVELLATKRAALMLRDYVNTRNASRFAVHGGGGGADTPAETDTQLTEDARREEDRTLLERMLHYMKKTAVVGTNVISDPDDNCGRQKQTVAGGDEGAWSHILTAHSVSNAFRYYAHGATKPFYRANPSVVIGDDDDDDEEEDGYSVTATNSMLVQPSPSLVLAMPALVVTGDTRSDMEYTA